MLSPGAFLLRFRTKYRHGLVTAYYRDRVRPRILQTPPVTDTTDQSCEIHVFTSASDWLNLMWALKSFYRYAGRNYALAIHDDGSLGEADCAILKRHFPGARLIRRAQADVQAEQLLRPYPLCRELRETYVVAPKVLDFLPHLQSDRMLLIDSDMLFFREPTALLERIDDPNYRLNTVNRDLATSKTVLVSPEVLRERTGLSVVERFNSGLGLIHRDSLSLQQFEEFLAVPGVRDHFWCTEQTLYMLCSARWGAELLPADYDVRLDAGVTDLPARHYVGKIRHLMYSEGIKQLVSQNFLN